MTASKVINKPFYILLLLLYICLMIDDSLSLKYHITYISSRVLGNIGIISKLTHYLSIHELEQSYINLVWP